MFFSNGFLNGGETITKYRENPGELWEGHEMYNELMGNQRLDRNSGTSELELGKKNMESYLNFIIYFKCMGWESLIILRTINKY